MTKSNTTNTQVVLTFTIIGPVIAGILPYLPLGNHSPEGIGFVFLIFFVLGIAPAAAAGAIYCQTRKISSPITDKIRSNFLGDYIYSSVNGAICGVLATNILFALLLRDLRFLYSNPFFLVGAIAGAACAALLVGEPINQISTTANAGFTSKNHNKRTTD